MITEIKKEDDRIVLTMVILPDMMHILDHDRDMIYGEVNELLQPYAYNFVGLVNDKYGFIVYTNNIEEAEEILTTAKAITEKYNGCVVMNQ